MGEKVTVVRAEDELMSATKHVDLTSSMDVEAVPLVALIHCLGGKTGFIRRWIERAEDVSLFAGNAQIPV